MNTLYENRTHPLCFTRTNHLSPTPHMHKEIEMVFVEDGEAVAVADHNQYKLKKGDLFISFPNQIHYYKNCSTGLYYLVIVSRNMLLGIDREFKEYVPESNSIHIEEGDHLITLLRESVSSSGKYRDTIKYGYLNLIIAKILPMLTLHHTTQANRSTIQKVIDFCHENYSDDITLDDIADVLHLNKYYISHMINRQIGLSFNNFINSLRVDAACDLLKDNDKKIADVADEVGFGSIRTFNRIFREQMDMTPREYRELFLGEKK